MNKKQLMVAWGLGAYIVGGLTVVIFNLKAFVEILRFQLNLFLPVVSTYSIILIVGFTLIYFLKDINN